MLPHLCVCCSGFDLCVCTLSVPKRLISLCVLWGKLARTMQGLGCGVYLAASCVILEVAVKFLERMSDFGKHRCCLMYKINGNGAALWP